MDTLARLEAWRETGAIAPAQFDAISAIVRKDRFSIFLELNALLYLGVLAFVAGVGWTIQTYFTNIGDAAIILSLTFLFGWCLLYCVSRAFPYSRAQSESPTFAFEYVLYLACLVFAVELGYIESRFGLLKDQWDYYLLLSSLLFFVLAYRFDNRFVLSLALSTLAGWFGLRTSRFGFISNADVLRLYALVYGAIVVSTGVWLFKRAIKRHFLETYLHIAANVVLIALVSGVVDRRSGEVFLLGLLAACAIAIWGGVQFRRFVFVVYGILYGYVGISARLLRDVHGDAAFLAYFVISAAAVVILVVRLARRLGREE